MAFKNSTLVNSGLVSGLAKVAQDAWDGGGAFFSPVIEPTTKASAVFDWPASLEAVTAVGWRLHTWTTAVTDRGVPIATPLFERP